MWSTLRELEWLVLIHFISSFCIFPNYCPRVSEISREVIQHEDPLSQDYINVFRSGVAGVLGGISGIITGQPLDTIRVDFFLNSYQSDF